MRFQWDCKSGRLLLPYFLRCLITFFRFSVAFAAPEAGRYEHRGRNGAVKRNP